MSCWEYRCDLSKCWGPLFEFFMQGKRFAHFTLLGQRSSHFGRGLGGSWGKKTGQRQRHGSLGSGLPLHARDPCSCLQQCTHALPDATVLLASSPRGPNSAWHHGPLHMLAITAPQTFYRAGKSQCFPPFLACAHRLLYALLSSPDPQMWQILVRV